MWSDVAGLALATDQELCVYSVEVHLMNYILLALPQNPASEAERTCSEGCSSLWAGDRLDSEL